MKKVTIIILIVTGLLILSGLFYYFVIKKKIQPSAQVASPSIALSPSSGILTVGQNYYIDIVIDSAGQSISGADVKYLHYPPQFLEARAITDGSVFDMYTGKNIDSVNGTISLSGLIALGGSQRPVSGVMATISFRVLAPTSSAALTFDAGWTDGVANTDDTNIAQIDLNTGIARDILQVVTNGAYTLQNPQPNAPTVDLKINGQDSATISAGSSVNLSWNSTNATSCSSSWGGDKNTSGTETIQDVTSSRSFTLTCQGSGGSNSDSVSVTVQAAGGGESGEDTDETGSMGDTSEEDTSGSGETGTAPTESPMTTTSNETTPHISKLPSNIQPQTTPTKKQVELYQSAIMKPWALWFLYAIIPAFLAGGAIFIYLRRKKVSKKDEII
ncbi:hypothetical protein A2V71_00970 [Candidatus Berkelbacteria bacterium RBG_13_40_8]|uniref:Cohesin domain-containing protein n=1 Tax=Candidatus Berkelbacteria bacterium RBG_13_40_8 TaxID=1797467 RepID=A0A1F5DP58_9BACT|nr:MAG: hypothetical protein A2V71_00970 [Candidatus Berkelbacteria bacterium RBG_13_40_8]